MYSPEEIKSILGVNEDGELKCMLALLPEEYEAIDRDGNGKVLITKALPEGPYYTTLYGNIIPAFIKGLSEVQSKH